MATEEPETITAKAVTVQQAFKLQLTQINHIKEEIEQENYTEFFLTQIQSYG